jgi:hypothetical protein
MIQSCQGIGRIAITPEQRFLDRVELIHQPDDANPRPHFLQLAWCRAGLLQYYAEPEQPVLV